MTDDIKTGRSMYRFRLLSCTMLVEWKSKQTEIDNRPKPMSSPNNNPAFFMYNTVLEAHYWVRFTILARPMPKLSFCDVDSTLLRFSYVNVFIIYNYGHYGLKSLLMEHSNLSKCNLPFHEIFHEAIM